MPVHISASSLISNGALLCAGIHVCAWSDIVAPAIFAAQRPRRCPGAAEALERKREGESREPRKSGSAARHGTATLVEGLRCSPARGRCAARAFDLLSRPCPLFEGPRGEKARSGRRFVFPTLFRVRHLSRMGLCPHTVDYRFGGKLTTGENFGGKLTRPRFLWGPSREVASPKVTSDYFTFTG